MADVVLFVDNLTRENLLIKEGALQPACEAKGFSFFDAGGDLDCVKNEGSNPSKLIVADFFSLLVLGKYADEQLRVQPILACLTLPSRKSFSRSPIPRNLNIVGAVGMSDAMRRPEREWRSVWKQIVEAVCAADRQGIDVRQTLDVLNRNWLKVWERTL